jgi:hypothetical protein
MLNLSRTAILAAGLGGAAWTVKALVITARDDSFGLLESILFVGGLVLLLLAAVLVARDVAGRRGTLAVTGLAVVLVAITFVASEQVQPLVRELASGDNLGLEQEGGILFAGVAWLLLAVAAAMSRRDVASPAVAA